MYRLLTIFCLPLSEILNTVTTQLPLQVPLILIPGLLHDHLIAVLCLIYSV